MNFGRHLLDFSYRFLLLKPHTAPDKTCSDFCIKQRFHPPSLTVKHIKNWCFWFPARTGGIYYSEQNLLQCSNEQLLYIEDELKEFWIDPFIRWKLLEKGCVERLYLLFTTFLLCCCFTPSFHTTQEGLLPLSVWSAMSLTHHESQNHSLIL